MNLFLCVCIVVVVVVLLLLVCVIIDDVVGLLQCEDLLLVKELFDQVVWCESWCCDSIQVWFSEKCGSDQLLDFSGKNKGD